MDTRIHYEVESDSGFSIADGFWTQESAAARAREGADKYPGHKWHVIQVRRRAVQTFVADAPITAEIEIAEFRNDHLRAKAARLTDEGVAWHGGVVVLRGADGDEIIPATGNPEVLYCPEQKYGGVALHGPVQRSDADTLAEFMASVDWGVYT